MTIIVRQEKGLIAICLILMIIPYISFLSVINCKNILPLLISQNSHSQIVQIQDSGRTEVYFVEPHLSANDLLKLTGRREFFDQDFTLKNGIKIIKHDVSGKIKYTLQEIDNPERLALGIPVNLNRVKEEDLLLIPGIGEVTAQRVLELRNKTGRFVNMKQLMEIKGIKENIRMALSPPFIFIFI